MASVQARPLQKHGGGESGRPIGSGGRGALSNRKEGSIVSPKLSNQAKPTASPLNVPSIDLENQSLLVGGISLSIDTMSTMTTMASREEPSAEMKRLMEKFQNLKSMQDKVRSRIGTKISDEIGDTFEEHTECSNSIMDDNLTVEPVSEKESDNDQDKVKATKTDELKLRQKQERPEERNHVGHMQQKEAASSREHLSDERKKITYTKQPSDTTMPTANTEEYGPRSYMNTAERERLSIALSHFSPKRDTQIPNYSVASTKSKSSNVKGKPNLVVSTGSNHIGIQVKSSSKKAMDKELSNQISPDKFFAQYGIASDGGEIVGSSPSPAMMKHRVELFTPMGSNERRAHRAPKSTRSLRELGQSRSPGRPKSTRSLRSPRSSRYHRSHRSPRFTRSPRSPRSPYSEDWENESQRSNALSPRSYQSDRSNFEFTDSSHKRKSLLAGLFCTPVQICEAETPNWMFDADDISHSSFGSFDPDDCSASYTNYTLSYDKSEASQIPSDLEESKLKDVSKCSTLTFSGDDKSKMCNKSLLDSDGSRSLTCASTSGLGASADDCETRCTLDDKSAMIFSQEYSKTCDSHENFDENLGYTYTGGNTDGYTDGDETIRDGYTDGDDTIRDGYTDGDDTFSRYSSHSGSYDDQN